MIHGSLIADLETERVMLLSALAIGVALCTVFHLVHTGSATAQEVNREKESSSKKLSNRRFRMRAPLRTSCALR